MRYLAIVVGAFLALQILGCTTTHSVRTIGKGNWAAEGSLGGPLITNLGPPIPIPNLFVGGRYGVRDDMDVSASYNLTTPISPGMALDLILADHWVPIQPGLGSQSSSPSRGWSLATGASAHLLSDFQTGFVAIPEFNVAGGWRYDWFNPFVGVSLGLNFYRPFDDVHVAQLSPFVGAEFIISQRAAVSLRLTFFDVTYNYYQSQVDWVYLSEKESEKKKYGLLGISLGFSWDFVSKKTSQSNEGGNQ